MRKILIKTLISILLMSGISYASWVGQGGYLGPSRSVVNPNALYYTIHARIRAAQDLEELNNIRSEIERKGIKDEVSHRLLVEREIELRDKK